MILRHINKIYMLAVWITFIVIYNIPVGIAIKVGITILVLSLLIYLFLQLKTDNT
jgi:hypothetical protein